MNILTEARKKLLTDLILNGSRLPIDTTLLKQGTMVPLACNATVIGESDLYVTIKDNDELQVDFAKRTSDN